MQYQQWFWAKKTAQIEQISSLCRLVALAVSISENFIPDLKLLAAIHKE